MGRSLHQEIKQEGIQNKQGHDGCTLKLEHHIVPCLCTRQGTFVSTCEFCFKWFVKRWNGPTLR
jgi:hypothetical protein